MRIIAGSHRGRRLSGPQGADLRPTSDKVREALFSILGPHVLGARCLDLYAGTGAVGIEALSRGASAVTFVDSDSRAIDVLRKNLETCRLLDRAEIRQGQTEIFLGRPDWWHGPYDIVFADPPYGATQETENVRRIPNIGLLAQNGLIILEQSSRAKPPSMDHAVLIRRYDYGDTALFLYGRPNSTPAPS